MPIDDFLRMLKSDEHFMYALSHHEELPPQPAEFETLTSPFPENLLAGLYSRGIKQLFSHQTEALDYVHSGKNVVAVTPTASGKSLLYSLPILKNLAEDPKGHALLLFPLKALEQDQAKKLAGLIEASDLTDKLKVGIYDGDTPSNKRAQMRKSPPNILITNPDMLHLSIMSYHALWEDLLRGLRFVVLDEVHIYRGIFGSHILHLMHRLIRLCDYYGSDPQFIATSATIAGAKELVEELTGKPFEIVEKSGAPISRRHFLFFNPEESYLTFALNLFKAAISSGLKVIAFTNARRTTEVMHMWLRANDPSMMRKVSSYRAGFRPEERRDIEQRLLSGELRGVITTSALELGIDIGGLDVCILVGYPGTVATTWQRAGRVGRGRSPAVICLVAAKDQLDQYYMRYPSDFFARPVERAVVDAGNEYVATPHILCAAQELPISKVYPLWNTSQYQSLIEKLAGEGKLLQGATGDRWFSSRRRPQRQVDIRTAGNQFTIEIDQMREYLGSVSGRSVFAECHPGAVYLHRAEIYIVKTLDIDAKRITVKKSRAGFYTNPLFEKETEILETLKTRDVPAGKVSLARLKVTEQLVGYQKRRFTTQELLSQHELEFPPTAFETIGLVLAIPAEAVKVAAAEELHFRGGIHGIEHAMLALSPMFALCDRRDMGGYSQVSHPQVEAPTVFLYDGYPGGIGLAARMFEVFPDLMMRTLILIAECPCEVGCPSCIQSPKCGHGNVPLDKAAAKLTMEIIAGKRIVKSDKTKTETSKSTRDTDIRPMPETSSRESSKPAQRKRIIPAGWHKDRSGVVFDLETQRSAEEVGGWDNIRAMGLAWAVVYRFPQDEFLDFSEGDVNRLAEVLRQADVVVGFNQLRFDYEVLRAYTGFDFRKLNSYDILVEITRSIGHRLSLNAVASTTLGYSKTADGLQSLQWWREGQIEKVAKYCRKDVEVTRDLFYHILEHRYLLFEKRGIGAVRIPLAFNMFDADF